MDIRAIQALELPKILEYLAGFTVSEAGRKACLELRPLCGLDNIRRQTALFEQGRLWLMKTALELLPFAPLDDFLRYLERPTGNLDLEDLWELRRLLEQAAKLRADIIAGETEDRWPLWIESCLAMPMPEKSVSGLMRCISPEGLIRDEASPELSLVRGELRRLHQQCARKVKDYAAEYNIMHFLQDSFMTLSSDRYVLPLKANFKGRLQGIIHDYSQTGETCYFEPMFLVELNNRLQELKREEREEEQKIIAFLSAIARDELPGIRACYTFLVELDMLRARHALGQCYDGMMILFEPERGVLLREAKHPLLALAKSPAARRALKALRMAEGEENPAEPAPGPSEVIPSTIELLPGQQAMVISGGNAGGKTVSLKSLGLIALMGMCVLPVPVLSGSVLPPWSRIHAFIGDEQSLDDHVSTFTAQISHLARIWPELGPEALVILDEFGAGTDPSQGAALAQAVVDSLIAHGSYVIAATHFPALKAYALTADGVRAASVLFDPKTKRPMFRLVYDQVGASQALDVAREHGLPEEVLSRAEQYLLLSGEDSSALVERLNQIAVERENELAAFKVERKKFAENQHKQDERFAREREKLFTSIQEDARKIMAEWKSGKSGPKQALKDLSAVRAELMDSGVEPEENQPAPVDLSTLHIRQRIRHVPWKRTGLVQEVDLKKNRVRLDMDGVSLWASAKDLSLGEETDVNALKGKGVERKSGSVGKVSSSILPLRLDLRGMRADVAVIETEKFLDGAILSGRSEIEIVHGRGTGALRREIHAALKTFPAVAGFRLAPEDQGGDGMTIVELK